MSKIFFIREVDELMTNKIKEMAVAAILETDDDYPVMENVIAIRHCQEFAKMIIEEMREKEADEDRLFAELRKETKTDGTGS